MEAEHSACPGGSERALKGGAGRSVRRIGGRLGMSIVVGSAGAGARRSNGSVGSNSGSESPSPVGGSFSFLPRLVGINAFVSAHAICDRVYAVWRKTGAVIMAQDRKGAFRVFPKCLAASIAGIARPPPDAFTSLVGRYFGSEVLTYAAAIWALRELHEAQAQRRTAGVIAEATLFRFGVSLLGVVGGTLNALGWSNGALHGFFARAWMRLVVPSATRTGHRAALESAPPQSQADLDGANPAV